MSRDSGLSVSFVSTLERGGHGRLGFLHYNTAAGVELYCDALERIVARARRGQLLERT